MVGRKYVENNVIYVVIKIYYFVIISSDHVSAISYFRKKIERGTIYSYKLPFAHHAVGGIIPHRPFFTRRTNLIKFARG